MPVPTLGNNDIVERPAPQAPNKISPPGWKGATVDTKLIQYDRLTTYIAGQAWDVDYYNQVGGRDDQIQGFQVDLPAVYQTYNLYKGFELKVTDALSKGGDSEKKDTLLSGSATIYGIFVPKEGDVFVVDIGDGREGMFQITATERLSHYETSPHRVEYSLMYLTSEAIMASLNGKVTDTKFFKKDWMQNGLEPLVHSDDVEIINNLATHYSRIMSMYFNDFYSRTYKSLLVPNQHVITYDPFLVRFLKTLLSTDEHPVIRDIIEFNVSEDQAMYEFTLWNCLANMDYSLLPMCVHEAGIVDVGQFYSRPLFNSVYYSGVKAVVYPDHSPTNVDYGYTREGTPAIDHIKRGRARFNELDRLLTSNTLAMDPTKGIYEVIGDKASPAIRRATYDNYYVLSEAFYRHTGTEVLSKLEILTLAALKGEAIDIRVLNDLCVGSQHWDNVERFYYIPILLTLLRVYPRRIK